MMDVASITINLIAPIFLVIGTAALFARIFDPNDEVLATLLIYVFVPALVLRTVAQSQLSLADVIGMGGSIVVLTAILAIIGSVLARLMKLPPRLASAFLISIVMLNAANYGIPLNAFAFGAPGEELATIYYVLTAIVGNNVGIFIAANANGSIQDAFAGVLKVPVFAASVLGILLNISGVGIPAESVFDRWLGVIASGTVPVMLVLLGIRLSRVRLGKNLHVVAVAVFMRLVVSALIIFPIAMAFGLRDMIFDVTVIQSATPSAVLGAAVAMEFNSDADFVSTVILVSTVLSIISMTVLLAFLGV